ncbi:MAG TPA: hypothetical protein VF083_06160 [Acidimicrobiia bacterium]
MSEHPSEALYRAARRRVTTVVLAALLLASCNGGAESPDSSSTTITTPTTESTSTTAGVTTTASPATTSSSPSTTSPPTTEPDGPSGSGCSPGDAASLPEGEWFGFVEATSATGIEFDLACWFTGQAAIDASAEDGEESPPPNDYYVRNESTLTRSLPVSPEVPVVWYPEGGDPTTETLVDFETWAEAVVERGFMFGVWLDVIDGEVHEIREQWVP